MIQAKKLVEALAGLVLTVVETAFLATYNLLPWNPGTRPWLVAGGVFGLLVGVTIGLQIPLTTGTWRFMITRIATPGLVGAAALFGLNTVVYRLGDFSLREGVLSGFAFVIFSALFYLSVMLVRSLEGTAHA